MPVKTGKAAITGLPSGKNSARIGQHRSLEAFTPSIGNNDHGGNWNMNNQIKLGLAVLAGAGLGAIGMDRLHAQARPPAYVISEIDVTNADAYAKEYVPLANKALADSGQKRLASGGKTIALAGAPPASRIVLSAFKNIEEAQAAYSSPAYLEARKIGDQYGKLRIFAVEGLPQ